MEKSDTIIVVGVTEKDGYGNLWVTPKGDGDRVKIGVKREGLHHLFEQGKAIILHWETYMNKPYVADAKLVEGELPQPEKPTPQAEPITQIAPQERGMWWKQLGDDLRSGHIDKSAPQGKLLRSAYFAEMFRVLNIKIKDKPE